MVESEDRTLASKRVANDLRARIEAGEFAVGDKLPPHRQLATDYGVAPNTATAAVKLLRDMGFVTVPPNASARVRDRSADVDTSAALRTVTEEVSVLRSELAGTAERLAEVERTLDELSRRTTH
ncbi:winged helix-turn-helix domain-containing protein [Saccharomonospora sp. NPDC006951]